ncbi:MAG: cyanophycinase, partial [Cyanobacteria bacterium J06638_6]
NRMARLISAMTMQPNRLGLGIDEDTCALFEGDGSFQVIGKGVITVVDPGPMTHTNEPDITAAAPLSAHCLGLHLLAHGDRFDLNHRQVLTTTR